MPAGPGALRFSRGLPATRQFGERLRLLVVQGPDKGTCFSLLGDLVFVGREGCQVVLNDSNISRKHAEIVWKLDHYQTRDLGSANGFLHNGQKTNEANLQPGDLLMMGLTVLEVYPAGQARKTERPLLPGEKRAGLGSPGKAAADPKQKEVDKKRMIIYVALFFVGASLYFSSETRTVKENAKIESEEGGQPARPKLKKTELDKALAEYVPDYALDTQQRKDAEVFFRNGVRELQNKNYRRAFTAFDTALTVDPSHDLVKIYLRSAKKEMLAELKSTAAAALRATKSLRYKEARMHYQNILRYLEGETGDNKFMENEANKEMRDLHETAKKALAELDKEEKRFR